MTPSTTALLDQADAATTDSLRTLYALYTNPAMIRGTIGVIVPGPICQYFIDRLEHGLLLGTTTMCPHLDPRRPRPAYWSPWASGRVRCASCHEKATRRAAPREDDKCDRCRRTMTTTHHRGIQLPAVVVDIPRGPATAVPPIQVHIGLCARCASLDGSVADA